MTEAKKQYISKRLVARGSKRVFKEDANKALQDHDFIVVAKDGWIVREYADGKIEKIKEIDPIDPTQQLILD